MRGIGKAAIVLIAGGLTACGPSQQEVRAAEDHAKCLDYGFVVGTVGYSQCRMALDDRRELRWQNDMRLLRGLR